MSLHKARMSLYIGVADHAASGGFQPVVHTSTLISRPSSSAPFRVSIAACASSAVENSTTPTPFDFGGPLPHSSHLPPPLPPSFMKIFAWPTVPAWPMKSFSPCHVVCHERLPTQTLRESSTGSRGLP